MNFKIQLKVITTDLIKQKKDIQIQKTGPSNQPTQVK